MLFVGAEVGGVSDATLPPCSSVLVCPCLVYPPCHFPPAESFLMASFSELKQQLHLFCQGWECTQPSLAMFLPATVNAKPVDLTSVPALLFLLLFFHCVCLSTSEYMTPAGFKSLVKGTVCVAVVLY